MAEQEVVWEERLLGVRSLSDVKTVQASLQERLDKAEAAPGQLTPARQRGKRQIKEEGTEKRSPKNFPTMVGFR